jgi:hypothetical protein
MIEKLRQKTPELIGVDLTIHITWRNDSFSLPNSDMRK